MKWHILSGGRGLRQQRPGATRENSDEGLDTPEADTQRSLRDWYVQVQADSRTLQKTTCDPVMSSSIMYNFGVGPRFAYVSASARAPK